jgi:hypothetical protein
VAIHGGVIPEERQVIQERFTQDKDCLILVATDAAGEGINLQRTCWSTTTCPGTRTGSRSGSVSAESIAERAGYHPELRRTLGSL